MRDTQLDHYRALMMMHVIIGHVMYWLYAAGEPYLSFVLFAMAGTFFIAGASVAVNTRRRSLWSTVVNRIGRVVIPFYIYAVVIIAFTVAVTALVGDTTGWGSSRTTSAVMAGRTSYGLSCARMFPVHPSEPTSGSCSPTSS